MKTSVSESMNNKCPICGGRTSQDHKRRGFVRHLERVQLKNPDGSSSYKPNGEPLVCEYDRKSRDLPEDAAWANIISPVSTASASLPSTSGAIP